MHSNWYGSPAVPSDAHHPSQRRFSRWQFQVFLKKQTKKQKQQLIIIIIIFEIIIEMIYNVFVIRIFTLQSNVNLCTYQQNICHAIWNVHCPRIFRNGCNPQPWGRVARKSLDSDRCNGRAHLPYRNGTWHVHWDRNTVPLYWRRCHPTCCRIQGQKSTANERHLCLCVCVSETI